MMSDSIQDAALFWARQLILAALGFAPTATGVYRGRFFVASSVETVKGNPRQSAIAGNSDPKAPQVEWGDPEHIGRPQGGSHGRPHRPLGRAGAQFEPDWHAGAR